MHDQGVHVRVQRMLRQAWLTSLHNRDRRV
jgi:hypothetical protein